jgi:hypothetical protein
MFQQSNQSQAFEAAHEYILFLFSLRLYSPIQALAAAMKLSVSLQLLDLGQSVGLLGRVISSSQGLYLYTNTEKRTPNTNTKHPCPEWDSNLRSRRLRKGRQFMPHTARYRDRLASERAKTVHAPHHSATVTGTLFCSNCNLCSFVSIKDSMSLSQKLMYKMIITELIRL